ncbi:MAG: hypothetical protein IKL27_06110 [Oscillospiraceae bacterium]|nr:hypothetical protein [Oscillospiraceae bacterium]
MEQKYGKKIRKFGTVPMVFMPFICLLVALIVIFGALLNSNLKKGSLISFPLIIAFVLMIAVLVVVIRLIAVARVELYDNAIVVYKLFGVDEYPLEKISAILWTFPGANATNSRAPRTNNTFAELIVKNQSKSVKLSADYYKDLEKPLTAYQSERNIPSDLETRTKHRY